MIIPVVIDTDNPHPTRSPGGTEATHGNPRRRLHFPRRLCLGTGVKHERNPKKGVFGFPSVFFLEALFFGSRGRFEVPIGVVPDARYGFLEGFRFPEPLLDKGFSSV